MSDKNTPSTDCRCPIPDHSGWFWCDRHQCRKLPELRSLCASDPSLFEAWNQGHGPGQNGGIPQEATVSRGESLLHVASGPSWKRFLRALVKHGRDWFRKCSPTEIKARLEICSTCQHYTGDSCVQCGCPVSQVVKFRNKLAWRSEACPIGKWQPLSAQRPLFPLRWRFKAKPTERSPEKDRQ